MFPPARGVVARTALFTLACLLLEGAAAAGASGSPSPSPTPSQVGPCSGVSVPDGADLTEAMASHPAGTTYCLAAGTFRVTKTIETEDGDRVIGAGRNATFIDGSDLPEEASVIFIARGRTTFSDLDIFGAPTPEAGTTGSRGLGQAFRNYARVLTLVRVDCHDNGGNCVNGAGSLVARNLDCWGNGNDYSNTPPAYGACVKLVSADHQGEGSFLLTNSDIHDNYRIGIWCDFCKYGSWDIENNTFANNGNHAIQWEMSGGWSDHDHALIKNNVFHRNGRVSDKVGPGGVHITTANDIVVKKNTFGGQDEVGAWGVYILFSPNRDPPQPDSRGVVVRDNTLNGDPISGCDLDGVSCSDNT